jgi:hypothetical protein
MVGGNLRTQMIPHMAVCISKMIKQETIFVPEKQEEEKENNENVRTRKENSPKLNPFLQPVSSLLLSF